MNLLTKYSLGDMVTLEYDTEKRQRKIISIEIYLDGGYQYQLAWTNSEGQKSTCFVFEAEIDADE